MSRLSFWEGKKWGMLMHPDGMIYNFFVKRETNDTKIILKASKYGNWTEKYKGREVARIEDDGNGATITTEKHKLPYMDYSALAELQYLLSEYVRYGFHKPQRVVTKKRSKK